MPGPDNVATRLIVGPGKQEPIVGMFVENTILGEGLDDWEVRESIVAVRADPKNAFNVQAEYTSGWHPAKPPEGEIATDAHLISMEAITFDNLRKDGDNTYQVSQYFEKKKKGQSPDTSEVVEYSAFTIKHTIKRVNGKWMYYSEKKGETTVPYKAKPGVGEARYPGQGWEAVLPVFR
jgi:hypothetical protein